MHSLLKHVGERGVHKQLVYDVVWGTCFLLEHVYVLRGDPPLLDKVRDQVVNALYLLHSMGEVL